MPSAAYQIVKGALPNFHTTYAPSTSPYFIGFHDVTPFEVGGVSYVVVNLGQMQPYGNQGQVATGPAANREIIFQVDPSGHLADVTQQLMGASAAGPNGLSLNSLAAQVVIADINGDGRPDIVVAENSEDGRLSLDVSSSVAQAQVHLSQPDGTYKLVNIGDPLWGALGSIQVVNNGGQTLIHLSGIDSPPTAPTLMSGGLYITEQPTYRLNNDGLTFTKVGYAPTYNYGSVVLTEKQMVTLGYGAHGSVFALAVDDGVGSWRLSSQYDPFPAYSVDGYYSWNNAFSNGVTVRSVDGVQIFEAFYALHGQLKASAAGPDLFLGNLTGAAIPNKESDGYYHARDAIPLNHFFLLEINNGALVPSSAKFVGENLASSPRGVQLLDLNGDGLTDIVATNVASASGGIPDIYMNDGHGHFIHVDPAIFPATGNQTTTYGTFIKNGDHYDLMVNPAFADNVNFQEPVYLKGLGVFPHGVYAMSAAELVGNLDALQVDFAEGHLTSIALEDKLAPTLALTAAQLSADRGVLSKVTSTFSVAVDGSTLNGPINGLPGLDTIVYAGNATDFTVTRFATGWTVQAPGGHVDTMSNVEVLRFADKSLWIGDNLDTTGTNSAETIDLAAGHQSSVVLNGTQINLFSRTDGGEAHGGAGGDILRGGGLASRLFGGAGADTITGGDASSNYLRGEDGNDSIFGGSGFDDINGNMGNDTLHGGEGFDWVVGGKDNDLLFGDGGGDIVYGNLGNDTVLGGDGNDWVRGGQGNDSVDGGAGDDLIWGDRGDDTVSGGAGADTFHFFVDGGLDRVTDFNYAQGDRVILDGAPTYTVRQDGGDTVIDLGGVDRMVLVGVTASTLPAGWITSG